MAISYNRIILMGYCSSAGCEYRVTPAGLEIATASLAVNNYRGAASSNEKTPPTWFRLVFFGKLALLAKEKIDSAMPLFISGRLEVRKYVGNDNLEKTSVEVIVQDFQILSPKQDRGAALEPSNSALENYSANYADTGFDPNGDVPF